MAAPESSWKIQDIPAYCINLDRRQDRWEEFKSQPAAQQLKLQRASAVDGKTIEWRTDPRIGILIKYNIIEKTRRSHYEIKSIGAVGCYLSHVNLWKMMVRENIPILLVLEDDAKLEPQFVSKVNRAIRRSPIMRDRRKWDILMIQRKEQDCQVFPDIIPPVFDGSDPLAQKKYNFWFTHCYVIQLETAKRLLERCFPIEYHVDQWLGMNIPVYGLRVYEPVEVGAQQSESVTDIQDPNYCLLCDIPESFRKTHVYLQQEEWMVHCLLAAGVGIGVGYALSRYWGRKI